MQSPCSNFHIKSEIRLKTLISLDKNIYDFNFVDLGSGKGKVIILAHKMGFKKILGVEISTKLNEICKNNLKKLGLNNIKIIEQDATIMKVLPENSVFISITHLKNQY